MMMYSETKTKEKEEILLKIIQQTKNFNDIWNAMIAGSTNKINLYAYKTTGGYEDSPYDKYDYHYANLFKDDLFYCSKLGVNRNIDVYAFQNNEIEQGKYFGNFPDEKLSLFSFVESKPQLRLNCDGFIKKNLQLKTKKEKNSKIQALKYTQSTNTLIDDSTELSKYFPANSLFSLHKIHLFNGGKYKCPGKTLALFLHDEYTLNEDDLVLLSSMNDKTKMENSKMDNLDIINKEDDVISFIEYDSLKQKANGMNLRLVLWVKMNDVKFDNYYIIDLIPFNHFGKFLIVKLIDSIKVGNGVPENIDFTTIAAYGNIYKLNE